MLKFDYNKLRVEKVYVSKVAADFVYIRRNLDDTVYKNEQGTRSMHLNRPAVRVPFKGGFAADFIRLNFVREFSRAKRAALVWYGDTLIHVELERGRQPESEGPWLSHVEASLRVLPNLLPADRDVHYDGQYIYWKDEKDLGGESAIDPAGRFSIAPVYAIAMADMGIRLLRGKKAATEDNRIERQQAAIAAQAQARAENGEESKDEGPIGKTSTEYASIKVIRRSILQFRPFAGTEQSDKIIAVSPVLERRALDDGKEAKFDDRRALYRLGEHEKPVMGSLEFVMKAADVIGTHYGHEAVDFLDLPKIIASTGEVNLHRIDVEDRRNMPIQHRGEDCIAWVMGFVYREEDLVRQRALTSMFRYVLRNGLVDKVDMDKMRKPEHAGTEIPLRSFRGGDKLATPAPF